MIFFSYYTYPATFGWTPERGTICAFDSVAPVLAGSCKTALFGLSGDASRLLYLSYFGANFYTSSPALTLRNNMAYLAGVTNSTDLPMTQSSYDSTFGSALGGFNGDGYYARLKIEIYPKAGFEFPAQVCRDSAVYFQNLSHCSKSFSWDFGDGDTSSLSSPGHIHDTAGTYTITLIAYNDAGTDTLQKSILVQYYNQQFYDTICEGDSIFLAGGYRFFPGIYSDTLQSTAGCDSIVHTSLVVNPTPMVALPADTLFCTGKSVELDAGNPGCTYLWSTGDTVGVLTITVPGVYTLTVTSGSACDMYGETSVTEIPLPYSTLTESAILCKGEVLILQTDTCPACQYLWNTGSTQPSISVSDSGTYILRIYNSHCEITDTSYVEECARLIMPNVFTPNADGYNDFFIPDYANVDSFELTIYNRWGKLIAKSGDLRIGWDGNSNNTPCPDGTYYFLAEFSGPGTGGKVTKGSLKGTVTLLR
jgi:gliding motility-associated-like protein